MPSSSSSAYGSAKLAPGVNRPEPFAPPASVRCTRGPVLLAPEFVSVVGAEPPRAIATKLPPLVIAVPAPPMPIEVSGVALCGPVWPVPVAMLVRGVCSLPVRDALRRRKAHVGAGDLLRQPGGPILPADERRGECAEPEGSYDETGRDRAREPEVAEGRRARSTGRHGVSVVSVRHVWHPLPWGRVGKLYAVL